MAIVMCNIVHATCHNFVFATQDAQKILLCITTPEVLHQQFSNLKSTSMILLLFIGYENSNILNWNTVKCQLHAHWVMDSLVWWQNIILVIPPSRYYFLLSLDLSKTLWSCISLGLTTRIFHGMCVIYPTQNSKGYPMGIPSKYHMAKPTSIIYRALARDKW